MKLPLGFTHVSVYGDIAGRSGLETRRWAVSRGGTGQSADDVGTASDWLQSADCGNID